MIEIRKIITIRETLFSELGVEANRPPLAQPAPAWHSDPSGRRPTQISCICPSK